MFWIIGKNSKVGKLVASRFQAKQHKVTFTSRNKTDTKDLFFDLENFETVPREISTMDSVLICAGLTSIQECERDPSQAIEINVHQTLSFLKQLHERGIFFVLISSNSIFEGQTSLCSVLSTPSPKSVYARTKLEVERYCLKNFNNNFSILRAPKIVTDTWPLMKYWQQEIAEKKCVYPFSNRVVFSVSGTKIAGVLCYLMEHKISGLYQIGSDRNETYADFCYRIFEHNPAAKKLIIPVADKNKDREKFQAPNLKTHLPEGYQDTKI